VARGLFDFQQPAPKTQSGLLLKKPGKPTAQLDSPQAEANADAALDELYDEARGQLETDELNEPSEFEEIEQLEQQLEAAAPREEDQTESRRERPVRDGEPSQNKRPPAPPPRTKRCLYLYALLFSVSLSCRLQVSTNRKWSNCRRSWPSR
jgi:hypothetical protein